jgi:hypothetical protein
MAEQRAEDRSDEAQRDAEDARVLQRPGKRPSQFGRAAGGRRSVSEQPPRKEGGVC